ncbi:MAG: DegT/DnrJ/EryC1/StrS family aminotransferase [Alphaproteobacteria bacterium]|nr:DegT/DnrJ/EryC1/StrS family aminotransferase [Alphaproteobacteria bacterium]
MQVPILRVPFGPEDAEFITTGVEKILASGMLTMSTHTKNFEGAFGSFAKAEHAISCTNGTSELELIIRGLGIEGKSIIVPTNTFLASAYAAIQTGNRVIFADCDPETFCLDPADVAARIEDDTAAVMLVHIGGVITPAIDELIALCKSKNIHLIEDCAHAHGCDYDGRSAGTLGVAGAFSFFPTKVLTMGEGGVVTTNDEALAKRIQMIRNHGKNPDLGNRMSIMASNFRISEITALIGEEQMRRANQICADRRRVATYYDANIVGIPGINPVELSPKLSSSYYKYLCTIDDSVDRASLKKTLKEEHGVSLTGEVYADLCHTEPLWDEYDLWGRHRHDPEAGKALREQSFPGSEEVAANHVCLPLYPGLTQAELDHVVASLKSVLGTNTS